MSGRDPRELLTKAAGKGKSKTVKQTRHTKQAEVLAEVFGKISVQLSSGEVAPARQASHRAHALLEVLSAMDAQDEFPALASPKCDERKQAAQAWSRLMRPSPDTVAELKRHFETRTFAYVRTAPLPPLPTPEPKKTYKGAIYESVFLPDDAKLAKEYGLPDSYTFRHGTPRSFHLSLHWAIERKLPPSKAQDIVVRSMLQNAANGIGYRFNYLLVQRYARHWEDRFRELRYSLHSTTHDETAKLLEAARGGKKVSKSATKRK